MIIKPNLYNVIDIVDGQQRLTTLVILLKGIERKLACSQPDDARDLQKLLVKGDDLSLILLLGTNTSEALKVSKWLLKVTKAVDKFLGDMRGSREAVTEIAHARLLAVAIILSDFCSNDKTKLLNEWEKTTFRIFGLLDKSVKKFAYPDFSTALIEKRYRRQVAKVGIFFS